MSKYPICDTDIWVDAVLADLDEALIEKYGKIIVADVVEWEILKFRSPGAAEQIAPRFQKYRKEKKIIVIRHSDIEERDRRFLEKQLVDCDGRFQSGLSDDPHEQHKGEIVSAIYAEYFELLFLKSNDGAFHEGEMGRIAFPDLVVKNLKDMLNDLVPDREGRKRYDSIIRHNRAKMKKQNEMYKEQKMQTEKESQEREAEVSITQEQLDKLLRKLR